MHKSIQEFADISVFGRIQQGQGVEILLYGVCCFGQTAVEAHNGKRADGDEKG